MSVFVGGSVLANACGLSMPGTCVTIGEPGLKPSSRFQSVVSIGAPATFRGVASGSDAQATPGRRGGIRDREEVVRPRQQAERGIDRVARVIDRGRSRAHAVRLGATVRACGRREQERAARSGRQPCDRVADPSDLLRWGPTLRRARPGRNWLGANRVRHRAPQPRLPCVAFKVVTVAGRSRSSVSHEAIHVWPLPPDAGPLADSPGSRPRRFVWRCKWQRLVKSAQPDRPVGRSRGRNESQLESVALRALVHRHEQAAGPCSR